MGDEKGLSFQKIADRRRQQMFERFERSGTSLMWGALVTLLLLLITRTVSFPGVQVNEQIAEEGMKMWRSMQITGVNWQALGVVVAFIVGVGGWIYSILALRSAKKDRLASVRPVVVLSTEPAEIPKDEVPPLEPHQGPLRNALLAQNRWLVFKNIGHGVAFEFHCEVNIEHLRKVLADIFSEEPEMATSGMAIFESFLDLAKFKICIGVQETKRIVGIDPDLLEALLSEVEFVLYYDDVYGKTYFTKYTEGSYTTGPKSYLDRMVSH